MRRILNFGCLFLVWACQAAASSSPQVWLYGSVPYETVSYREANMAYALTTGQGNFWQHWLGVEYGILDRLDAGFSARYTAGPTQAPSVWLEEGRVRWRLGEEGQYPVNFGLIAKALTAEGANFGGTGGLVLGKNFLENEFSLNLSAGVMPWITQYPGWQWNLAWRSHYILEGFRLGLEGGQGPDPNDQWGAFICPQASYDLPGDLSLQAGASFQTNGWHAHLQISYESFPSP